MPTRPAVASSRHLRSQEVPELVPASMNSSVATRSGGATAVAGSELTPTMASHAAPIDQKRATRAVDHRCTVTAGIGSGTVTATMVHRVTTLIR